MGPRVKVRVTHIVHEILNFLRRRRREQRADNDAEETDGDLLEVVDALVSELVL